MSTIFTVIKRLFISLAVSLLVVAPRVHAQLVQCGGEGQNPCTFADLASTVQNIFRFATFNIAVPAAAILVAWGGITMAISGGNENKFNKGKKILTGAAIGLLIVFGAYLIVQEVTVFVGISK